MLQENLVRNRAVAYAIAAMEADRQASSLLLCGFTRVER